MTILIPVVAVIPLRQRLINEMDIRRFGPETHRNYIRDVGRFATFLGRSPDTATAEEVRRFRLIGGRAIDAYSGLLRFP
ncbi:phage integrase N-terminal SAM-like domain-containing protein [Sphingomonas sp. PB2P12]|uniref:phage integrase N-terminal SAM-like domain-containing protein n=1 Tax=Sphingomonas sandaracina TaxID=3096157 RepID=UPI002FC84EEB